MGLASWVVVVVAAAVAVSVAGCRGPSIAVLLRRSFRPSLSHAFHAPLANSISLCCFCCPVLCVN